ncbi:acetoacetate--CoA ligase [Ferrimicrobium sp.]|uniref:acetoacetate--CoA ligase n=1 Tax=Ferrimicrobium sp. TaxID=2926050 RepID=UPI00261AA94F|nr:acetoacetate--CoA ligase [Ferrimicrobium sp.]
MTEVGDILWEPSAGGLSGPLGAFLGTEGPRLGVSSKTYDDLYRASITKIGPFWRSVARFCQLAGDLGDRDLVGELPDAVFFPDGFINYAQEAYLRFHDPACIVKADESGMLEHVEAHEFWRAVAQLAASLQAAGVGVGDRVAGYLPNIYEAVVGLFATASIGAIWSCTSPDFGVGAVVDRFRQIEPKVVLAVTEYRYGGRLIDRRTTLHSILDELPSVRTVIVAGSADGLPRGAWSLLSFDEAIEGERPLIFARVPFNHPLWVLYSSGTTGVPKAIVHSHGGIVLEHKKVLELQNEIADGSTFFWYSSTGWMMWNFLMGGLLVGASIVLYDGSPGYPDLGQLWRLIDRAGIDFFGVSAPFLRSSQVGGVDPRSLIHGTSLRAIGSTGAPLTIDGFDWVYRHVPGPVQLISASGGTDVCTAFLGSSPMHPTRAGLIAAPALGVAVAAFDESGTPVVGTMGELVITEPMPSMPIWFWNDGDRSRYHEAYFAKYPGVWRHGDWVTFYADGSSVIYGRSDSTLNRGGVRMGTAEFYRVVEAIKGVQEALVIDTSALDRTGELILFLVLTPTAVEEEVVQQVRAALRRELSPRHVPDRFFMVSEVPKTLNGKKLEVPIRRLFLGEQLADVASSDSVANPGVLSEFEELARLARP